jgi:hypothetical protein
MAETITSDLIYEILKKIQPDVSHMRGWVDDHDRQFIALRDKVHGMHRSLQTQIHDLQGNMLRLEKGQTGMVHGIDHVKRRLELAAA